jgi:hypothetical protein
MVNHSGARFYSEFWTAGLKFILVSSTQLSQDLWLPLFLNDMSHFEQLVSNMQVQKTHL